MEIMILRFVNLIRLSSMEKMRATVRKMRLSEELINKACIPTNAFYFPEFTASYVEKLQHQLKIQTSEFRYANITALDLEAASELFINLIICPGELNSNHLSPSSPNQR